MHQYLSCGLILATHGFHEIIQVIVMNGFIHSEVAIYALTFYFAALPFLSALGVRP